MKLHSSLSLLLAAALSLPLFAADKKPAKKTDDKPAATASKPAHGWLTWRGPLQNGVSLETGLPDKVDAAKPLWSIELCGRGTPVVNGNRVYAFGYEGEKADLQQVLRCLDADTGKQIWEARFNDFLSDIVYDRYSIGSAEIDPQTGNVYVLTAAGEFAAFTGDGRELWRHSMMEEYGRLTFPNGRTGGVSIDGDLAIVRGITSNWGSNGPAADRFYAFDKNTGEIVWTSTPGTLPPKDSSFSQPVFAWENGRRVFYAGTGDGSLVCVNARTGDPVWRYKYSAGGVNAAPVILGDMIVTGHGDENLDSSEIGRTLAVKRGAQPEDGKPGPVELDKKSEVWRNPEILLTSSPVVVGEKLYEVNKLGELLDIDPKTGKVKWRLKLGADELHASPVYGDGKLYVPMRYETGREGYGGFFIVKPTDKGGEILSHTALEGEVLGAPSIWNGKIYVHTTKRLYCFGKKGTGKVTAPPPVEKEPKPGPVAQIQVVPAEVALHPGESQAFKLRGLDAKGIFVSDLKGGEWKHFIPPTAKVKAEMNAEFNEKGELVAAPDAKLSAGAFQVTVGNLKGEIRGRVLPGLPYAVNFDKAPVAQQPDSPPGTPPFAYPPLPWIGARFKWQVREVEGKKMLVKTLDIPLFQRAFTFIGDPTMSNYTVEADVMSDGNRRTMSNVGVINQRYNISLLGNYNQIEVTSNQERIKVSAEFPLTAKTWYHIKARVDVAKDGSGVVRAKAWKKGDPEPEAWTIEVPHKHAHTHGSPGIYGFGLQNQFAVYVDNIVVTPNK